VKTKSSLPNVQLIAMIPADLDVELKVLLANPVQGRVRYGAMSNLVTKLLRNWVAQQKKEFASE
jgi:hypothetical protein